MNAKNQYKFSLIEQGEKFGRLTIIECVGIVNNERRYKCLCECGNIVELTNGKIRSGHTKSCGCLMRDVNRNLHTTHGHSAHPLYKIWENMKTRCYNPKSKSFKDYGAKNVMLCEEWKNSFENFYNWAIQNRYKEGLTIDRIDSKGNYEPSNCRWATRKEQNNNRCNTIYIEAYGERHTISEWVDITGLTRGCISSRYHRGLRGEQCVTAIERKRR